MLNALNINKTSNKSNFNSNKILTIKNLNFGFHDKKEILKNISFSINIGDFACIIGKNGSGKSTLLRLILNLIKDNPTNSIQINTKHISYIPQAINFNKDFPITVKEFLKYNSKELNIPFSHAKSLVEKYDLTNCFNSLIGKLSGGQLQKLMLIRALLKKSDLLIIDEPTNNLDEESKNTIYTNLKELNEQNMTILVVEHDKNLSIKYANKIFLIEEGYISCLNMNL